MRKWNYYPGTYWPHDLELCWKQQQPLWPVSQSATSWTDCYTSNHANNPRNVTHFHESRLVPAAGQTMRVTGLQGCGIVTGKCVAAVQWSQCVLQFSAFSLHHKVVCQDVWFTCVHIKAKVLKQWLNYNSESWYLDFNNKIYDLCITLGNQQNRFKEGKYEIAMKWSLIEAHRWMVRSHIWCFISK